MAELAQVVVMMAIPAALLAGIGYLNRRWDRAATTIEGTRHTISPLR